MQYQLPNIQHDLCCSSGSCWQTPLAVPAGKLGCCAESNSWSVLMVNPAGYSIPAGQWYTTDAIESPGNHIWPCLSCRDSPCMQYFWYGYMLHTMDMASKLFTFTRPSMCVSIPSSLIFEGIHAQIIKEARLNINHAPHRKSVHIDCLYNH